jgi:hypothetical protein
VRGLAGLGAVESAFAFPAFHERGAGGGGDAADAAGEWCGHFGRRSVLGFAR